MKRSHFSDKQIIGMLKQHEDGGILPRAWDQRGDVLSMEVNAAPSRQLRHEALILNATTTLEDPTVGCP